MPATRELDRMGRPLTDQEAAKLEMYRPVLQLWTAYLNNYLAYPTYREAVEAGAPIMLRHQRRGINPLTGMPHFPPVAVHVETAQLRMHALALPAGLTRVPLMVELAGALHFMGLEHDSVRRDVASFLPSGESHRVGNPYRRRGWWQLHGEVVNRLKMGKYTPVLTPLRGRPPRTSAFVEMAGPARRPPGARMRARGADVEVATKVVRDYLATGEPTCLMEVARDELRPVAIRKPGRPLRSGDTLPLLDDVVVVSAHAVGVHARAAQTRLGLPETPPAWWSPERTADLLAMVAKVTEGMEVCPAFATMDSNGRRSHGPGWFRVSLSWAGAAALDHSMLAAEWSEHLDGQAAEAAARQRREDAENAAFEREWRMGDQIEETSL